jgi:hypothetical protein
MFVEMVMYADIWWVDRKELLIGLTGNLAESLMVQDPQAMAPLEKTLIIE